MTTDNLPHTLVVLTGPTGSGKSALALQLAQHLGCDIISADSRQIYREMSIGTAAPTADELNAVPHHFVATLDPAQYYSAACFEEDVMQLLPGLFRHSPTVVMCGGSMMYIDAVTRGIDYLPTISDGVRRQCMELFQTEGLEGVAARLSEADPAIVGQIDMRNPRRVVHALEICIEAGQPYSSLRTGRRKERPFNTIMLAIDHPRQQLFDRINRRTEQMIADGLIDEARRLYDRRRLNALNTVGYKEMFKYLDGEWDLPTAIARMQKNTRVYAKKQLTWMKTRPEIQLLDPNADTPMLNQALDIIKSAQ